jgi:hypothetical protein
MCSAGPGFLLSQHLAEETEENVCRDNEFQAGERTEKLSNVKYTCPHPRLVIFGDITD